MTVISIFVGAQKDQEKYLGIEDQRKICLFVCFVLRHINFHGSFNTEKVLK